MPPSAPTGQRAAASFSLGEEGNTTVDIVIQPAYQQLEAVKALLLEYTSMLLEQNPAAAGSCLQRQNFEGELANLAEKYGTPQGRLYLIRVDGAPAGCAAMKRLDRYRCELKRLYIRPPFRGQGLARRLFSPRFLLCHNLLQKVQTLFCYAFPLPMGSLLAKLTARYQGLTPQK